LFSAVYYSNILYENGKKVESILAIVNGITPINDNQHVDKSEFLLSLILPFQQILDDIYRFWNVENL
jgi:hypothetical protein